MDAETRMAETLGKAPGVDIPDPAGLPSLKGKVSDEEWRLHCELAATCRLTALYGWKT